ncbi:MAG: shikimate kinase [Lactobacillus sp.]|jgi:shikimate kinase|nr:shikimate kinase [Lactobacillus sp.]MCI2032227.1 shikimate kinase [Lactobacillus sp.]
MKVILIGFMGSGKSTIGRGLADRLAVAHTDLDELIVQTAGCSIPDIFSREGEQGFRQRETACLRQAVLGSGILSTGGGTAVQSVNRAVLAQAQSPVVWLTATPETVAQRIGDDANRPLGRPDQLAQLLAARTKGYQAVADLVIPTDHLAPSAIIARIQSWLARQA